MNLAANIPLMLADFGEPACLPTGKQVTGLFDPYGDRSDPWGSEVGLTVRVSQQPSPTLLLKTTDAADLAEKDEITLRDMVYRVTGLEPDRHGLSTVRLMPVREDQPADKRWR